MSECFLCPLLCFFFLLFVIHLLNYSTSGRQTQSRDRYNNYFHKVIFCKTHERVTLMAKKNSSYVFTRNHVINKRFFTNFANEFIICDKVILTDCFIFSFLSVIKELAKNVVYLAGFVCYQDIVDIAKSPMLFSIYIKEIILFTS